MRQVVTRTVTYCRTPLEPAPNGNLWKRRKIEHDDGESKALTEDETPAEAGPSIKEEKQDEPTAAPSASDEAKDA